MIRMSRKWRIASKGQEEHSSGILSPPEVRRMLVVDENISTAGILRDLFESGAASVTTCARGCEAMILTQVSDFDLIVLDLRTPPGALEILRFLRTVRPLLVKKTILLAEEDFRLISHERLIKENIPVATKPLDAQRLLHLVRETIDAPMGAA
jgi:CheY-like chemotaxis protein